MSEQDFEPEPAAVEAFEFGEGERILWEKYLAALDAITQWERVRDELIGELMHRMGTATKATIDGQYVATKMPQHETARFSTTRFREQYPQLYRDFCVPTVTRAHFRRARLR